MDEKQYLKERLEDQLEWYDKKSQWNQKYYKRLRLIEILAASFIPFLSGMSKSIAYSEWIIGLLGVIIMVVATVNSLYKLQENWIQYRTTHESLKHEKYLFHTRSGPYIGREPFLHLVERVEGIISKENTKWSEYITKEEKSGVKPDEKVE